MAGSLRKSSKRRAMVDINVVPYIDVMLVLLVIFMATAPMVNPGVVNLPTVGGAKVQSLPPVFLTIDANENVIVRKDGEPVQTLNKFELGAFARSQAENSAEQPVVLAADKSIKYEVVMEVIEDPDQSRVLRDDRLILLNIVGQIFGIAVGNQDFDGGEQQKGALGGRSIAHGQHQRPHLVACCMRKGHSAARTIHQRLKASKFGHKVK